MPVAKETRKRNYPVKNSLPLVPGNRDYSDTVRQNIPPSNKKSTPAKSKKLLVLSTSITKGIDNHRFNECFEEGTARFQKWGGGRARHIKNYVASHLQEEKPDAVIVQAGGNDLAEHRPHPIANIASDVMQIALNASKSSVQHVFVGGVTFRDKQFSQSHLYELNHTLESMCRLHGFTFINNDDITTEHLFDGVHLNKEGTRILADNYLEALRNEFNGNMNI